MRRLFDACSTARILQKPEVFASRSGPAVPLVYEGPDIAKSQRSTKNSQSGCPAEQSGRAGNRGGGQSRGYASPSAFIRAAIRNELSGHSDSPDAEQRVSAGFDRIAQEVFRVGRSQQALFALVDALTKTVLTCIPEPPADARPQAVARGRERYDRLIKSAGRSMVGDAQVAMQELTSNAAQG